MTTPQEIVRQLAAAARTASHALAASSTAARNKALERLADRIERDAAEILRVNAQDVEAARLARRDEAFLDRLALTEKTIASMAAGCRQIAALPDPIGRMENLVPQPSGIIVGRMSVPLGVLAMIYEARPNVTVDAAALAIKSGNAILLRGGTEALGTNLLLASFVRDALAEAKLPPESVQMLESGDRELVGALIRAKGDVDVLIPRGGKSLIARLAAEATVPMIKHLEGICHTYVDDPCDLEMAVRVTDNAKTQRYAPCNATETLLVHRGVAFDFLPEIARIFHDKNVEMRCDGLSRRIVESAGFSAIDATEEDWVTEYGAPIISIKTVESLDEAILFINEHGSHHTDAILTTDHRHAERFLREVDSSSVMVNASTRFADGFEYGLGAEIGISTDKLHARGPVGLEGLTSRKFIVLGHGEGRR